MTQMRTILRSKVWVLQGSLLTRRWASQVRVRLSYSPQRLQPGADPNVYPQQLPQPQLQAQGQVPPVMPDHNVYTAQPQPQPGQPQVRDHDVFQNQIG